MDIHSLDHIVLTVKSIPQTVSFYTVVLNMQEEVFIGNGVERTALKFGSQKINLHQQGKEFKPGAETPLPGTGDLCFLSDTPIGDIVDHLHHHGVEIIEGPVARTGATGKLVSVYLRDPDQNLIEISNLVT